MYYKRGFISYLFLSFLSINIPAQVNVLDTPYCQKSFEFLKNSCYECDNYSNTKKCKVEKFDFLGNANNKNYYYGVYLNEPFRPDYKFYHFAIYEENSNGIDLKPIHFFHPIFGGHTYYDFKMTKSKYGYIIHIHLVDKDAGYDEGEYIICRNGKWERLRQPAWSCAAEGLLPENFYLDYHSSNSYIKIDLKSMSIKIPVQKIEDDLYTPTDGYVLFNLVAEQDRFGIANSKYTHDSKIQKTDSGTDNDSFSYCERIIDFLQNNCYTCEDSSNSDACYDREFKYLGEHKDKQYYYGIYLLRTLYTDDDSSYFVIYEGKKGGKKLKPVYFLPLLGRYSYNVEMTDTKYGLIIHIELVSGNGNWDFGEYIINRKGKWKELEIPNWECVYEWIIPEDTWFCRGNYIDLKEMTNTFAVFSDDDACCCPTRGFLTSKLTIDENGFRVISSKYDPDFRK